MKILELHVQGFRSLKDITWKPGDLNVIIGPNGSGKSNLLRILELISVSAQGGLGKHVQSQGGISPLLWDGQATEISWKLETTSIEAQIKRRAEQTNGCFTYMAAITRIGNSSAYRIERELMTSPGPIKPTDEIQPNILLERKGHQARACYEGGNGFASSKEPLSDEETLLSSITAPLFEGLFIDKRISMYRRATAGWTIYPILYVGQDSPIRQAPVARLEKRVDPDGQNLISVLHTLYTGDRDFKREINAAMNAAFGDDFEELVFPPAADQRIQLRLRWKSLKREQSAADISDGTLRFLFLLTVLASPDPAPLIAIDELEVGLHPSMLPIVAEYAVAAAQRSQVILTTHSPQFLDAFKPETLTTTVALWQNGQTVLKVLSDQTLQEWLKGYSLGSLFKSGELESLV